MSGSPLYDRDQLQPEDTLIEEPTGDVLDTGYEPADSNRGRLLDETVRDQAEGESLEERLAQEEPEDPALPGQPVPGRGAPAEVLENGPIDGDTDGSDGTADGIDEIGSDGELDTELTGDPDPDEETALTADGRGPLIDPSAEEEAMHVIDVDEAP